MAKRKTVAVNGRLGEAAEGDAVRLAGDDCLDDRGSDVVVVLAVSKTRVKVQRLTLVKEKWIAFRAVELSPDCLARVVGRSGKGKYEGCPAAMRRSK